MDEKQKWSRAASVPIRRAAVAKGDEYLGVRKHLWEDVVNSSRAELTKRLRVPGGWLYFRDYNSIPTMVFVPYES